MDRLAAVCLVVACLGVAACSKKQSAVTVTQGPPSTASAAAATQSPAASATPLSTAAALAAQLAAMNGFQCIGIWKNTISGGSGAFATRLEAGGAGGTLHFEIGGGAFGVAQGIVFDAPFQLIGNQLSIEAHSEFMGHMSVRVGLDGTAQGGLQEIPNYGPKSSAMISDYSLKNNKLHFALTIDTGDGRPPANSIVDAACAQR